MNPAYPTQNNPSDTVPLQEMMYDGPPGQPQSSTMVQYTTVNINSEPPKDYIIWSLWCFVYGNPFCLGLAALMFSIKARDRKMVGDMNGAKHYGTTARCLNITATVLVSLIILIVIIAVIVIVVEANKSFSNYNYDYNFYSRG